VPPGTVQDHGRVQVLVGDWDLSLSFRNLPLFRIFTPPGRWLQWPVRDDGAVGSGLQHFDRERHGHNNTVAGLSKPIIRAHD
jgi:hypothetical protein